MGMTFQKLIKTKILKYFFFALNHSDVVFILLINVKMPTIIGILTFMSRININLSSVEHEKSYTCSRKASVELTSSKYTHLKQYCLFFSWESKVALQQKDSFGSDMCL